MAKADLKKKVVLDIPTTEEEKKKALQSAIAHITKVYGTGAIMRLGENKANLNVEAIPTGSMMLDMALGIGGVPRGRIIEIYGPESSGKTTLALHILAQAQKLGGEVAFVDAEHALDPTYARALGVRIEDMLISQPDTGEQALDITEALVRSGAIDVVVVDKLPASYIVDKNDGYSCAALYYAGAEGEAPSPTEESYAICVTKGNDELLNAINEVLEELGTEGVEELIRKHMGLE